MTWIADMANAPTIEEASLIARADLVAIQDTLSQIENILKPTNQWGKRSIFKIFAAYGHRKAVDQSPELMKLKKQLMSLSNEQLKLVFEQVSEKVQEQQRNVEALRGQKLADELNMADSPTIPLKKWDINSTVQAIQSTQHSLDAILQLGQIYQSICAEITRRHRERNSANVFGEQFKPWDTCILLQDEQDIELIPAGTQVTLTEKNGSSWYCLGTINGIERQLLDFVSNLKLTTKK
jgi:hypothetical protein